MSCGEGAKPQHTAAKLVFIINIYIIFVGKSYQQAKMITCVLLLINIYIYQFIFATLLSYKIIDMTQEINILKKYFGMIRSRDINYIIMPIGDGVSLGMICY